MRQILILSLVLAFAGVITVLTFNRPAQPLPAPALPSSQLLSEEILPVPATISAQGVVIIDPVSGAIIAGRNPHRRFMPASTTKMMTAYIALKTYASDEIITITRSQDAVGKSTKFTVGEQYQVIDILKAALINSGNDAALSLADHYPDGYPAFVDQMNRQVRLWGLKDTHFTNVSGVEEIDHYSSAADLAFIAARIMEEPILRDLVQQPSAKITSIDGRYHHSFENTNKLLGQIPGVIGIKTGWTDIAGECLITYIDRDKDYIVVVLQSLDRFADTKQLINWIYSDYNVDTAGM